MCNPAAIGIGLSVGSTILGYSQSKKAAKKQEQASAQAEAEEREALAEQARQTDMQTIEEMSDRAREAWRERGRLQAIAADSGLEGISQERLLQQSYFNEGFDLTAIDANRDRVKEQLKRGVRAAEARGSLQRSGIQRPSLIGAGLQIGGALAYYGPKLPSGGTNAYTSSNGVE
jgi:hypothetical protein